MFYDHPVIDTHGHVSTPPQFRAFAFNLIALRSPKAKLTLSDEQMSGAVNRHLEMLDSHRIDVQLLSPRPVAMMQWEEPSLVATWTTVSNDIIAQQCRNHASRFVGIAQLPQSAAHSTENCVAELERCVGELGFVGAILNPDPGADRSAPGVNDPYWFPLYKKAEELRATLIVHPSISRDPRLAVIPASFQYNNMAEEALATLLYENSDVFDRFPKLKIVVCHCGGALRRLLGRGQPVDAARQLHGEDTVVRDSGEVSGGSLLGSGMTREKHTAAQLSENLFFDTCAYDPHFLAAAICQRGVERMVLGTEVPGSGSDLINPLTGAMSDDVLALIDAFPFLNPEDKVAMTYHNPMRVFPLLRDRVPMKAAS